MRIAENRLLKRLAREKIVLGSLKRGKTKRWPFDVEAALALGLLFRALAPMKNLDRIRAGGRGSGEDVARGGGLLARDGAPPGVSATGARVVEGAADDAMSKRRLIEDWLPIAALSAEATR